MLKILVNSYTAANLFQVSYRLRQQIFKNGNWCSTPFLRQTMSKMATNRINWSITFFRRNAVRCQRTSRIRGVVDQFEELV